MSYSKVAPRSAQYLGCALLTMILPSTFASSAIAEPSTVISIEAESGTVAKPMKVHKKKTASGGKYLSTGTKKKGSVTYAISIAEAGEYELAIRAKSPSTSKNSFLLSLNGASAVKWELPILKQYGWATYPRTNAPTRISLQKGIFRLGFLGDDKGTEADVIKLTKVGGSTQPPPPQPPPPPPPPKSCTFNTKSIASGASVTAYRDISNGIGGKCSSEQRTCTNGVLSGSFELSDCPAGQGCGNMNPSLAPGQNVDLSKWKLTLPVASNGGFSGGAGEKKPIDPTYQIEPYFYTGDDGAIVFSAPVAGATTSGSKYPRSELREMNGSALAAWTVAEGGSLTARLRVNTLPTTSAGQPGNIVIGQIHGPDDELCRVYYDKGNIYFYDDKAGTSQRETRFDLKDSDGNAPNIQIGELFTYSIVVADKVLTVSVLHNGTTYTARDQIGPFWLNSSQKLYFKAGLYVQVGKPGSGAGTTGSGEGSVSFCELSPPSHP